MYKKVQIATFRNQAQRNFRNLACAPPFLVL